MVSVPVPTMFCRCGLSYLNGDEDESQTFCQENLPQVQGDSTPGRAESHLRKPPAQAAPGLKTQESDCGQNSWYRSAPWQAR